jgi:tetratricopeptide (TPR) repeat protein
MLTYFKEFKTLFFTFFVISLMFYGNSLKNKYALDDDYITVTNFPEKGKEFIPNHKLVSKGILGIPKIWKSRYAHDSEGAFDYRPVTTSSFAIEYSLFGQNPILSHLINIILYSLNVWLLFCVLMKLLENYEYKFKISFLCSFIFLIHPAHTEVVNNLKCRDELLAFLFSLLALWYCLKSFEKQTFKNIILILLFLILGLLSKRTAIIFFAIIPLCFLFFRKINLKHIIATVISILVVQLVYVIIKNSVVTEKAIRNFYHFENPLYTNPVSIFQKIIIGIKTLGFYIKFMIVPYPFRYYYGSNTFDLSGEINIFFIIGILSLLLSAFFIYKQKNKLLTFSILLFLGSIAPFLNVLAPAPGVLGERFTYISSFGFSLIIAWIIAFKFKKISIQNVSQLYTKQLKYLLPVIFILMIYVWNRNSIWYNKITLFEKDIIHLNKSAKANSLLANEYFEMLRSPKKKYSDQILIQKCIKHYSQAVGNDSTFFSAYNNLGVVYYSYLNDIPNAKKYFSLGIRHRPLYSQAYENLGNCFKQEKNEKKAFESYKTSIVINPKQYTAFIACYNLFFENKKFDKALKINLISQIQFPNTYELIAQEANCYLMKTDTIKALDKYQEAYNVNPNSYLSKYMAQKYLEIKDTVNYNLFYNK